MPAGKLMPNPIPNAPWTDISVDFIISYNNKIQKSIKISPFYTNYGFNPQMGFEP